eukprot:gene19833-25781_t
MFKDEEGFLSEWVGYYQMHGFDHIMMFDDGSTDGSLNELKPWIDSGFVSIITNWTLESIHIRHEFTKNDFKKTMTVKALLERQCKLQALKWGYNLTISLDIDEYVIPRKPGENFCNIHFGNEAWRVNGKGKPWYDSMDINHYSRSLEKYAIKSRTWKTATGEIQAGQTAEQAAKNYDVPKFLARNLGWYYDDTALRYSCQLRELLRNITNEDIYLRPGYLWYRNPEFGKEIHDPDKRGRYGRENAPGYKFNDGN